MVRRAVYFPANNEAKREIADQLADEWEKVDPVGYKTREEHTIDVFKLSLRTKIFQDPIRLFGSPLDENPDGRDIEAKWHGGPLDKPLVIFVPQSQLIQESE